MARTRRSSRIIATAATLAVVAAASLASGAQAADDSTTLTVTLEAPKTLSIDAPSAATASGLTTATTIDIPLATTTVSDSRGTLAGWQVTATATDLTGSGSATGKTIAKTNMVWSTLDLEALAGGLLQLDTLTVVAPGPGGAFNDAGVPVIVAAAVETGGGGSYSYKGKIILTVPANAAAGEYTGTVKQTIL